MREDQTSLEIAMELATRDWVVREGFLDPSQTRRLRAEAEALRNTGCFRAAGIGHGAERRADVRGDELLWLEPEQAPRAWEFLQTELEALRLAVNATTFLGLQEFEGHYAAYPPGTFYARHLDRFQAGNRRVVSMVLYLNEAWEPADGGELRLYPDGGRDAITVLPRGGTLVCFLSEHVLHEVLPAQRLRLSLAGWFLHRV